MTGQIFYPCYISATCASAHKRCFIYYCKKCLLSLQLSTNFDVRYESLKYDKCSKFDPLPVPGNTKGGSITVPLTSYLTGFGISCMITDNFCFYLQNRLIQTSPTGGLWYSDTSPFSIPCLYYKNMMIINDDGHKWHLYYKHSIGA
jgi:hypothetical protein